MEMRALFPRFQATLRLHFHMAHQEAIATGSTCMIAFERLQTLGGRPGLPVPNSPCGFCGRKATLNLS